MSKPKESPPLTGVELEIMHIVWQLESCTVRQVHRVLVKRREIAYTTVMTVMSILENKGHLRRHKEGRAFVYEGVRSKNAVISGLVDDFVERVFQGSAQPLVVNLLRDRKISAGELEKITRMVEEVE